MMDDCYRERRISHRSISWRVTPPKGNGLLEHGWPAKAQVVWRENVGSTGTWKIWSSGAEHQRTIGIASQKPHFRGSEGAASDLGFPACRSVTALCPRLFQKASENCTEWREKEG